MYFKPLISSLGTIMVLNVSGLGRFCIFLSDSFRQIIFPPVRLKLVFQHMEFIGVRSFWIITMASVMVGAIFGIQFGQIFRVFGAESMIGAAASFALSKELAPVIGSFLVTGRAGSAITAEIANMKVNEQIDAMQIMAVNPIGYLVSPRILAAILIMPLLTAFFILCGVISAYIIGVEIFQIDEGIFIDKIRWITKPKYLLQGLQKSMIFGAIFASIGCFKGFYARGGAKGVGKATTEAVVSSLVVILVLDFFLSYFQQSSLF